uniref:Putative transcriptional regulator n=1 Tax=Sulfolobus neozealandicus TaxID=299422 RepID=Q5DVE7_9CREN|nr:putative transcriptional regulator [Sulfolobus neozealandicus]
MMSEVQIGRKKRTKYEILHDILSVCENGAKKTWIMYKANLSHELTNEYINELIEKGLIVQKDGLYYLTDKGKQLLDLLREYLAEKNNANAHLAQIENLF